MFQRRANRIEIGTAPHYSSSVHNALLFLRSHTAHYNSSECFETASYKTKFNLLTIVTPCNQVYSKMSSISLQSGQVRLYRDISIYSTAFDIFTHGVVKNSAQRLPTFALDSASLVYWNLPVGSVVTLIDDTTSVDKPSNDIHSSRCFDCVGTGKTEFRKLTDVNLNDCVSAFVFYDYDVKLGYIEFFEDSNFGGNCMKLFLSRYQPNQVVSISSWYFQDRASSVKWDNLGELAFVSLMSNADGSGNRFDECYGFNPTKSCANLRQFWMNDAITSFRWSFRTPMKETIAQFRCPVNVSAITNGQSYRNALQGKNDLPDPINITLSISEQNAQTITSTVVDSNSYGWAVGSTASFESGETGGEVKLDFNGSKTNSLTSMTSTITTIALTKSANISVPPNSSFDASLVIQMGKISDTPFQTTATRWYDVPVVGGVRDPANYGWYKRDETIKGTFSGSVAGTTDMYSNIIPLA